MNPETALNCPNCHTAKVRPLSPTANAEATRRQLYTPFTPSTRYFIQGGRYEATWRELLLVGMPERSEILRWLNLLTVSSRHLMLEQA